MTDAPLCLKYLTRNTRQVSVALRSPELRCHLRNTTCFWRKCSARAQPTLPETRALYCGENKAQNYLQSNNAGLYIELKSVCITSAAALMFLCCVDSLFIASFALLQQMQSSSAVT